MKYRFIYTFVPLMMLIGCQPSFQDYNQTIDLSGTWKFQLDSANLGIQEKWENRICKNKKSGWRTLCY